MLTPWRLIFVGYVEIGKVEHSNGKGFNVDLNHVSLHDGICINV